MESFPIHDTRSATDEAADVLGAVEAQLGFIPNVFGALANSTPALLAFADLNRHFGVSSLSVIERETVQIAASVERGSEYCVAGHTRFARDQHTDDAVVESLRRVAPVRDARLEALATFTRALVRSEGHAGAQELEQFLAAGYDSAQALEVILGICVKTLSNLTSNLLGIPLDEAFASSAWQAPA